MPFPLPSIWTVMYPMSIHKGYETNSDLSQRKGNKINNLSRQHPSHFQQPTVLNCPDQELFQELGLVINKSKCHMVLTQEFVFLGFHLSSVAMTVCLPQEKIKQEASRLLQRPLVLIQYLDISVGMTTAAGQATPVTLLYHHQLQALINCDVPGPINRSSTTGLPSRGSFIMQSR